jgi:large subunit ribosomal protein LP0
MAERKQGYFTKLIKLLEDYQKVLIVHCDNVGSNHMQSIRANLRGKAELLMGKNTMMRKAIKGHLAKNTKLEALLPHLKGNVGLVFTNDDLKKICVDIDNNKKRAQARIGSIAPIDVFIPAGVTTLDPSFTGFMQALNISTRISKGCIEILTDIHLIKKGDKVGSSEAALLEKLDISPFFYGLIPLTIYDDGECYPPKVLDLNSEEILKKVTLGVQRLSALSLQIHFPITASVPHLMARAFQNLCCISVASDYTIDKVAELKELLDNPEALAAAAAASATQTVVEAPHVAVAEEKKAPAAEPKKEEPKEEAEEEEDGGFGGLFD